MPEGADVDIGVSYDNPVGGAVISNGETWAYQLFGAEPYLVQRGRTMDATGDGEPVPVSMIAVGGSGAIDAAGQSIWGYAAYPKQGFVRKWPLTVAVRSPVCF